VNDRHQPNPGTASVAELIALGRDREAVELATRERHIHRGGEPMDGVQQLEELMPMLQKVVDGIAPEQLDLPTPCVGFTVAGVLEHMIGGATAFAPAFRGEAAPVLAGNDPGAGTTIERWHRAMAELGEAVHSPGAQERTVASPFGDVPGSMFARYVAFDGLVHGWDLASATGQPYDPPAELVVEAEAYARQLITPPMRDGDTFAAEVEASVDANPIQRLVAFSGRRPMTAGTAS
jgi:uncharacterized protein (TIGR03086 family)